MSMSKLTLSADRDLIKKAKKMAAEEGSSLSALFSRLMRSMTRARDQQDIVTPLTWEATGLIRLPKARSDEPLIEEALARKYGIRK